MTHSSGDPDVSDESDSAVGRLARAILPMAASSIRSLCSDPGGRDPFWSNFLRAETGIHRPGDNGARFGRAHKALICSNSSSATLTAHMSHWRKKYFGVGLGGGGRSRRHSAGAGPRRLPAVMAARSGSILSAFSARLCGRLNTCKLCRFILFQTLHFAPDDGVTQTG